VVRAGYQLVFTVPKKVSHRARRQRRYADVFPVITIRPSSASPSGSDAPIAWCVRCLDSFNAVPPASCLWCREPLCSCPECTAVHAGQELTAAMPRCPNLPKFLYRSRGEDDEGGPL
jgi:hypothetical protein